MNKTRRPLSASGIQLRTAQSLPEFMQVVEGITPSTKAGLWFRGQSDASYSLLPGALRRLTRISDGRGLPIKEGQIVISRGGEVTGINPERMLDAFKRQARPFLEWIPSNDFEWMFVAQHHGLPTRLLDWSTNALVALFFAAHTAEVRQGQGDTICEEFLDDEGSCENGFAVFVMDPGAMNQEVHDIPDPIDIAANFKDWKEYIDPMAAGFAVFFPICVVAPHISSRIRAQSGTFTLHGSNIDPIDHYDPLRPLITKIFLPFTATKGILKSLRISGVNHNFIYPGLDSIARDIIQLEEVRHCAENSEYFASIDD